MRVVVQRVSSASFSIEGSVAGAIGGGLLVFAGFEEADSTEDIEWMSGKVVNLRIFGDEAGLMNVSVKDLDGDILMISQFTLHANTKKGNRPSFIRAAKPTTAIPLYNMFIKALETHLGKKIGTGVFGADMKVTLVNDGPVTINIDSKNRE